MGCVVGRDFSLDKQAVIDTGTKFEDLSGEYKSLMGAAGLPFSSTGDAETDNVLDTALRTVGELHLVLAQAIYDHGEKLYIAAEEVNSVEDDLSQLLDNIFIRALRDPGASPDGGPGSHMNIDGNQGG
jgi:Family of unknown function (DUF6317)